MSNRRKLKDRFSKLKGKDRVKVAQQGLAAASYNVAIPDDEAEIIKEVPAVVTHPQTNEKVTVGTAFIHDDGSVAVRYDPNAPQWAMDLIKATAQEVGYSLETGEYT